MGKSTNELKLTEDDIEPFKLQLRKIYTSLNTEREEHLQQYKLKSKELEDKIERLEERFISEEIKGDLYEKFLVKFALVNMATFSNSKLEKYINRSLDFLVELPSLWASSDYKRSKNSNKQSFQKEFTLQRKMVKLEPRKSILYLR